jgi:hypothetical protein
MNTERPRVPIPADPDAELEKAFITEYLRGRGYDVHCLHVMPEELVKELMTEASVYASGKLTEIEARASFVDELHGASLAR